MNGTPEPSAASRHPVDADRVAAVLHAAGVRRFSVDHVGSTGSTNADLAARANSGTGTDRTVLLAEEQVSARGRMGRPWSAPAGSQFICSLLLAPEQLDIERLGELPLFIGVAIAGAARELGVPAVLKWPNDVQVVRDGVPHKLAGILVEAASVDPPAIVPGIGLNLSMTADDFEDAGLPTATSLTLEGLEIPDAEVRDRVTAVFLRHLLAADDAWRAGGDAAADVRTRYRELSSTLGTRVRAELPGGENLYGTAVDLGTHGELVLESVDGTRHAVTAGDVVHLRPDERER